MELLLEIKQMFPGVSMVLVTNATDQLTEDLEKYGLSDQFDLIVNSFDIGFAKPDVKFYEHAHNLAKTKKEGCIFIDDSLQHVEVARAYGFKGIHFVNRQQALFELRDMAHH